MVNPYNEIKRAKKIIKIKKKEHNEIKQAKRIIKIKKKEYNELKQAKGNKNSGLKNRTRITIVD